MGDPIAYLPDGTPVVVERQFESDGTLHVEIAEGDPARRLNVARLLRCVQEAQEVAEGAMRDGVTLDPEWLYEHASIALNHPVEPLGTATTEEASPHG